MGGGNGQKSAAKREKNQAKMVKKGSTVNQKEAAQKALTLVCAICRTQFMATTNESTLKTHTEAKHAKEPFSKCFPDWKAPE